MSHCVFFFARLSPQRLRRVREQHGRGLQGCTKVGFATFIWALVVHAVSASGSLGHHLRAMSGSDITDASAHERRQGLGWAWFKALFEFFLQPLAQRDKHPESFYQGMRLLGIDGSQFSLRNTAAITQLPRKRHNDAAFLKWGCAVLLELGTHQPLAVACAQLQAAREEGELTLARQLLGAIPGKEQTLLLADRYYGRGAFLNEVITTAGDQCHVLIRVPDGHKAKVVEVLSDGSAIVEVRVCHPNSQRTQAVLRLREVRGEVWREASDEQRPETETETERAQVRLWTTLLDAKKYPAAELLALYAQRWEHELFFRELKRHVGREQLLRAGTEQGLQAEFGALIIAASLLAEQRLKAAQQVGLPPLRLSLTKIGRGLEALLPVLQVAGDVISSRQRKRIIEKFMAHTAREACIPPRRSRSCQRGLRKPASHWPRIQTRSDLDGSWAYAVKTIPFS